MDYIGKKCPVCNEYFHAGEDIVVCPECGTPSHRECYLKNGKCVNFDKHAQGYDYGNDCCGNQEPDEGFVICKKCGAQNEEDSFFCRKCSAPLTDDQQNNNTQSSTYQNGSQPFGGPNVMFFDPLAGVDSETEFAQGVTAGECAKLTKQNTQYFSVVFNTISKFNKSRFNFCAFIFGGGYLLYRKMYKIGSLITTLQGLIMILRLYINFYVSTAPAYTKLFEAYGAGDLNSVAHHYQQLASYDMMMITMYAVLSILALALSISMGVFANRMYFNHCKKQITLIKSTAKSQDEIDKEYAKKGGVNVALAMSLLVSEMIIQYIPYMFV